MIYHRYKRVICISVLTILSIGCAQTSKREPPKRTEPLVYHVFGIVPPSEDVVEKCRKLQVELKSESCLMTDEFARNNRYIDSLTKAAYGVSVLEVLAQQ